VKKLSEIAHIARNYLLDLVLPEHCLGCKLRGQALCISCLSGIRACERDMDTDIYAYFDYRDPLIKNIIWNLKYYNQRGLGVTLGNALYEGLLEEISDINAYENGKSLYVIPVPISKSRTKARGYNQAERIARGFCKSAKEEKREQSFELKKDILRKKKDTLPQAQITNRTLRLQNVRGAFEIKNKEEVIGRTIIVIDDVTTTGGTLKEIMKVLKRAGAKKVVGFAVAH
jgi:ComF family protein